MSKGSRRRIEDVERFNEEFDRIFGKNKNSDESPVDPAVPEVRVPASPEETSGRVRDA